MPNPKLTPRQREVLGWLVDGGPKSIHWLAEQGAEYEVVEKLSSLGYIWADNDSLMATITDAGRKALEENS